MRRLISERPATDGWFPRRRLRRRSRRSCLRRHGRGCWSAVEEPIRSPAPPEWERSTDTPYRRARPSACCRRFPSPGADASAPPVRSWAGAATAARAEDSPRRHPRRSFPSRSTDRDRWEGTASCRRNSRTDRTSSPRRLLGGPLPSPLDYAISTVDELQQMNSYRLLVDASSRSCNRVNYLKTHHYSRVHNVGNDSIGWKPWAPPSQWRGLEIPIIGRRVCYSLQRCCYFGMKANSYVQQNAFIYFIFHCTTALFVIQ